MQAETVHLPSSPKVYLPGEHEKPCLLLARHFLPVFIVSPPHTHHQLLQLARLGPHSGPPAASAREAHGMPLPLPWPQARRYLVLELPVLKEPQLILTFQVVPINVAEIYLRTERGCTQITRCHLSRDGLHVLS